MAPIYTNFEGPRAKKRNVLVNTFQKVPKNLFCGLLFSENWSKWGLYSDLRELTKTIGSILKKNDLAPKIGAARGKNFLRVYCRHVSCVGYNKVIRRPLKFNRQARV